MYSNEMLFAQALNISSPWFIKKVEFKKEEGELHIDIDFKPGSLFTCKKCNTKGLKAYDTEQKTWRHLNFFQYKAFIHCRTPRSNCPTDGPLMVDVPWGRPGSGFTILFEAFILELAKQMPVNAVAKLVDEHDTRIWRILNHYVETAREKEDYSAVEKVGMDETSCKKGHNYVTLFTDMETSKVLFVTEGKDAATVTAFKKDLKEHSGIPTNVDNITCDMSPAFAKGIEENFHWANVTLDKFHVIKMMNEAVDEVRRLEQKEHCLELKNTRYIWLKNPNNLTTKQQKKLESLSHSNLKTGRAYRIKLSLQEVYTIDNKNDAVQAMQKWYQWAIRSQLEPIKKVAECIKRHWEGICNYFDSKLTNATLEGINSVIQATKSRARGYRSTKNFITMIYLVAGKLNIQIV